MSFPGAKFVSRRMVWIPAAVLLMASCGGQAAPAASSAGAAPAVAASPASSAAASSPRPSAATSASTGGTAAVKPSGALAASASAGGQLPTVRMAISVPAVTYSADYVAQAKGYFTQHGVKVQEEQLQSGATSMQALLGGSVDMVYGASQDVAAAAAKGAPLLAVQASTKMTVEFCGSKAFADQKGITAATSLQDRMKDLKGTNIAITGPGANSDRMARWLLKKYGGLNPDTDATFTTISSATGILASMQQGRIQAFIFSPPQCEIAVKDGYGTQLVKPADVPEFSRYVHTIVFTTKDWASAHKDVLSRTVTALSQGNNFIIQHPQDAMPIIEKKFSTIDPKVIDSSVQTILPLLVKDGKMTEDGWKATNTVLQEAGIVKQPMDTTEGHFWTNDYIGDTTVP